MATEMVRLPLPDPDDDAHPLDWYPGDEPEFRTVEEAERWVNETLTRRQRSFTSGALNQPTCHSYALGGITDDR